MSVTSDLAACLPRLRGKFYDLEPGDPLRRVPNLIVDAIDRIRELEARDEGWKRKVLEYDTEVTRLRQEKDWR